MFPKSNSLIGMAIVTIMLGGCSSLTPRISNPMLTDYQAASWLGPERDFGTTALTATHRMVLFKLKNLDYQKVCAEPPPPVGEQFSKAINAALEASASRKEGGIDTADLVAKLASSLSTTLIKLEKPKGIQYEQDLLYFLCQLHMNNALQADQVAQFYQMVSARAENLLMAEIGAEKNKEVTLSDGDLTTSSRVLKESEPLEMVLTKTGLFDAYHSADVIVREITARQPKIVSGEWKVLGEASPDEDGKISLNFDSAKVGITGDRAALLQAGIRIQRRKGSPVDAASSGFFVYYKGQPGQATVVLKPADKPLGEDGVQLAIQLPALFQDAYPGLLADMELKATSLLSGDQIRYTAKRLESDTASGQLLWQLRLDDAAVRDKLGEARKTAAVPLDLSLVRPAQASAPKLPSVQLEFLQKAKSVTGLSCALQQESGNVIVNWTQPAGSVTQYIIKRWLNVEPSVVENIRTYAANALQQSRFDLPASELQPGKAYGLRVKAVNEYGEADDNASEVCNFNTPKPAEQKP